MTRVVAGLRFTEDVAVESNFGVGANDDRRPNCACRDRLGFGGGQALDEIVR